MRRFRKPASKLIKAHGFKLLATRVVIVGDWRRFKKILMRFKLCRHSTSSSPEVRKFEGWLYIKELFDGCLVSDILLYLCDRFELIRHHLVVIKHICLFNGVIYLFLGRSLHYQTTFGHISLGYCCLWGCCMLGLLSIVVIEG